MKSIIKMLGIIAFVAIIGFSMLACIIDTSGGNGDTATPNTSLNGVWKFGDTSGGWTVNINGSTGTLTQVGVDSAVMQDAVRKGYFNVGDQWFRNISKTGDLKWSCQYKLVLSYDMVVAVGTDWKNCTITMNSNGKTIEVYGSGTSTSQAVSHTFARQ
jgi:hypothetical protein